VLLLPQQIQYAQARWLRQGLKVVSHPVDGLLWKLGHAHIVSILNQLIK
jgi:hypothetical protein